MQNLWRFPERSECSTLIVALRGASPQGVNRSAWWMPWYPTFREMSQLEHVASEHVAVVMPDQDFPLYPKERSKKAADQINRIISDEQPDRAFCFAFSKGASFFVETASKHCQFDGAVICSGVDPPMELDGTPRYGVDTLVLHETQEFWSPLNAGLVSTEATAKRVEGIFGQLGRCERKRYPGKHRWPSEWNQRILNWFGIVVLLLCLLPGLASADELSECKRLAPKYSAETEVVMPDGSRCDLLSEQWAIEVDWAAKWKESIGQAVLYSVWTGRKPAVLILVKDIDRDKPDVLRCRLVCERLGIAMFTERTGE